MSDNSLLSDVSSLSSVLVDFTDIIDISVSSIECENVRPVLRQLQNVAAPNRPSTSPMTKLASAMGKLRLDDEDKAVTETQQKKFKYKENTSIRSDAVLSREPRDTPLGQQTVSFGEF